MKEKPFSGVTAAVLTPRLETGEIDVLALRGLLSFLLEKGIRSFALNGATGEYNLTDKNQLRTLLRAANEVSAGAAQFLCGVGGPNTSLSIAYAQIAEEANVAGLLLPMPAFFPYQQGDLEQFCRNVAEKVTIPILLYNLPLFTTPLQKETAATLISSVPHIVGIKDSSGSLDIFLHLAQQGVDACRIVGDDRVLSTALQGGHCDGVVSGVAGVAPELVLRLYSLREQVDSTEFRTLSSALTELIAHLNPFPTPWGLKIVAASRGLLARRFPIPLSPQRQQESDALAGWFPGWYGNQVL